jgi:hypothetical protein
MANDFPDIIFCHTGQRDEAMLDAQKILANNVQVMAQEQVIVLMDTARQ